MAPSASAASAGGISDAAMAVAGPSASPAAATQPPTPAPRTHGRSAPVRSLPNKHHKFVVVEYPGVVSAPAAPSPSQQQQSQQHASSPASSSASSAAPPSPSRTQAHARSAAPNQTLGFTTTTDLSGNPSLARALQTLDPRPPALASPAGGLSHLRHHLATPDAVIECRIGSAGDGGRAAGSNGQTSASGSSSADVGSTELFRHPLHGHVVSTNDGVLRLRTRVWRRRRLRGAAATDAEGDSAMSAPTASDEVQVRHEHTAEILGLARHTLRFRQLADFAFEPAVSAPPPQTEEEATEDDGTQPGDIHQQTMQLLSALQRMDVDAMSNFRFMPESESWGTKDFMVTPPAFAITTVARKYGFRQNPASRLQRQPDGTSRYVNANRWRGLAPPNYSMKSSDPVPEAPMSHIEAEREKSDPAVLQALEKCFEERPIWTRVSLLNTLAPAVRKMVGLHKQYLPLFCYTTKDGPWRDCLIRYAFDPRADRSSRFYQRFVFMNRKNDELPKGRVKLGGDGRNLQSAAQAQEDDGSDGGEDGGATSAEPDAGPRDDDDDAGGAEGEGAYPQSHVFNGVSLEANSGRFMLCDITDPIARPLIEADGPENVRDTFDMEMGFYTKVAYERIKNVLSIRFHAVLQGREATQEECDKAIALVSGSGGGGDKSTSAAGAGAGAGDDSWMDAQLPSDEEERMPAKRGRGGARGAGRGRARGRARASATASGSRARGSRGA